MNQGVEWLRASRRWIKDADEKALESIITEYCAFAHRMSQRIPVTDDSWLNYYAEDTDNGFTTKKNHFIFPIPGYSLPRAGSEGLFYMPTSNSGDDENITVVGGKIVLTQDEDDHSSGRDSGRKYLQLKEVWSLRMTQHFEGGQPSCRFTVDLDDPGFLIEHGFKLMSREDVTRLPAYGRLLAENKNLDVHHTELHQQWDAQSGRWRGYITARVKRGVIGGKLDKFYLE